MDYQGIGMITVFLILVTLFVMSITSKTSNFQAAQGAIQSMENKKQGVSTTGGKKGVFVGGKKTKFCRKVIKCTQKMQGSKA